MKSKIVITTTASDVGADIHDYHVALRELNDRYGVSNKDIEFDEPWRQAATTDGKPKATKSKTPSASTESKPTIPIPAQTISAFKEAATQFGINPNYVDHTVSFAGSLLSWAQAALAKVTPAVDTKSPAAEPANPEPEARDVPPTPSDIRLNTDDPESMEKHIFGEAGSPVGKLYDVPQPDPADLNEEKRDKKRQAAQESARNDVADLFGKLFSGPSTDPKTFDEQVGAITGFMEGLQTSVMSWFRTITGEDTDQ